MTTFRTIAMTVAALAASGQLAVAESPKDRTSDLRTAKSKVVVGAQNTKGGARMLMDREARKIDRLIQDLEAGRSVDPAEIDRALERAEHPGF